MIWPFNRIGKSRNQELLDPEALDQLRDYIHRDIRGGFREVNVILESAIELVADEFEEKLVKNAAPAILKQELESLREEIREWPKITDCDKLDLAFSALVQSNIYAVQNADCCQTCASGQVWGELESLNSNGKNYRGMTFYHEQDTESATEGGGIYLSYGSLDETPESSIKVGKEICDALRNQGLEVNWNEDLSTRIYVNLDWKRKRR